MNWFKQKAKKESIEERQIQELKRFRDKGETFKYLGKECIVIDHRKFWATARVGSGYTPLLQCRYVDNNGTIQEISFKYSELQTLISQNKQD